MEKDDDFLDYNIVFNDELEQDDLIQEDEEEFLDKNQNSGDDFYNNYFNPKVKNEEAEEIYADDCCGENGCDFHSHSKISNKITKQNRTEDLDCECSRHKNSHSNEEGLSETEGLKDKCGCHEPFNNSTGNECECNMHASHSEECNHDDLDDCECCNHNHNSSNCIEKSHHHLDNFDNKTFELNEQQADCNHLGNGKRNKKLSKYADFEFDDETDFTCELDPSKMCDNCGKCLDSFNTDAEGYAQIKIDKVDTSNIALDDLYKMYGLDDDE